MTGKSVPLPEQLDESALRLETSLRENLTNGASEIARSALAGLAEYCQLAGHLPVDQYADRIKSLASRLIEARPSMAPVGNLVRVWTHEARVFQDPAFAVSHARALIQQSQRSAQQAAANMASMIGRDECLMTHSMSSTVRQCLLLSVKKGVSAIVTESRPGNEGHALAQILARAGIQTTYITDAEMGIFLPQASRVILGADMVLADGSAVNKSGSYLLALAAREAGVPVYICCESFKYANLSREEVHLERQDPAELNPPVMEGITTYNQYFELIPEYLISAIVTESEDPIPAKTR